MSQHMWAVDHILRETEGLSRSADTAHYLALNNPKGYERAILWLVNGAALYLQQFEADGNDLKNDRCMQEALLALVRTIEWQLSAETGRLDKSTLSRAVEYLRLAANGDP